MDRHGQMNMVKQPAEEKHPYIRDLDIEMDIDQAEEKVYHFEETVKSWPDYLKLYLHPKSMGAGILPRQSSL
jgi:hypothetical protein